MYIKRAIEPVIESMINTFKVVLITGPRQVGKSTTLKYLLSDSAYEYVSLDDYNELNIAKESPKDFFMNHPGKVIIDEIQYAPGLFREIKFRVDQSDDYGQYVLIGSQTYSLMHGVSESLAGRIGIIQLDGFSLREITQDTFDKPAIPDETYLNADRKSIHGLDLWHTIYRGSMPELIKNKDIDNQQYYGAYLRTYLERDVRTKTNVKDLGMFFQFIQVLAARVAQVVNYSEIAREIGVSNHTIKAWMAILEASGLIALLQPFLNNQLSRVIKSPKVYFMDSGLVSYLLRWTSPETLMAGAMSGPILENFAVSEIIKSFHNAGITRTPIYYYRDKDQREIDIIVESAGHLFPIEIKGTATPNFHMARHFSVLERAQGFRLGPQLLLSKVEKKYYLSETLIAYPIGAI
jgi:hypothetical protein